MGPILIREVPVSNPRRVRRSEIERRHLTARVLLVDASEDSLDMYAEWCRHVGLTVLTATEPALALTLARQHQPHVVVADVRVCRGFDGLELLEQLRCDPVTSEIPRVVLTGFLCAAARELAELSGCQAFLAKPCAPERLVEEIADVLRRSRTAVRFTGAGTSHSHERRRHA